MKTTIPYCRKKGICQVLKICFLLFFFTTYCFSQKQESQKQIISDDLDKDNDGILDVDECGFVSCAQPILNGSFELPNFSAKSYNIINATQVEGWKTTASDGKIEIWSKGVNGVTAANGSQCAELNANLVSTLYQFLCLTPGAKIKWEVKHRGRNGVDVAEVLIGADLATAKVQETMSDGNTSWGYYFGEYVVPDNQNETVFAFKSVSSVGGNSSGNLIDDIKITVISQPKCKDTDMDGIPDNEDLDSDNDGCNDTIEAGFNDPNNDGILGDGSLVEDGDGKVISGSDGYTTPLDEDNNGIYDFLEPSVLVITKKIEDKVVNENKDITLEVLTNITTINIFWEVSVDNGNTWTILTKDIHYSGELTNQLKITNIPLQFSENLYRVVVSDVAYKCGLFLQSTAKLEVVSTKSVAFPDGFSPNNDGVNDVLLVKNRNNFKDYILRVFDRNGYEVYVGNINSNNWDGKSSKEKELPSGVYFYVFSYNDGIRKPLQGRIHLRK